MSTISEHKSAEYWMGWQAVQTRQLCPFNEPIQRDQWAMGFAAAVEEGQAGKVWYKSKTIRVTGLLCLVGIGIFVYGHFTAGASGDVMMGAGSGLSIGNLVSMALRSITNESVYWSSPGAGSYGGGGYLGGSP